VMDTLVDSYRIPSYTQGSKPFQMAFALVVESPDYDKMTLDARVEEVTRTFEKLSILLVDKKETRMLS
jgi:hypothetical protein